MRAFLIGCALGFLGVLGARLVSAGAEPPGSQPTATKPVAGYTTAAKPDWPALSAPERPLERVVERRPPDLVQLDALAGHLYGDPIPWDDPEEARRVEETLRAGGKALEAAGKGSVLHLDCTSYPCIALVDGPGTLDELAASIAEYLPGVGPTAWFPADRDHSRVRMIVQQDVEDLDPWDVTLLGRRADLEMEAMVDEVSPESMEAARPLPWGDW